MAKIMGTKIAPESNPRLPEKEISEARQYRRTDHQVQAKIEKRIEQAAAHA